MDDRKSNSSHWSEMKIRQRNLQHSLKQEKNNVPMRMCLYLSPEELCMKILERIEQSTSSPRL